MKMIHLIGGQALPNVLPILAHRPTHVIHILSKKDPTKPADYRKIAAQIEAAIHEAGLQMTFEICELSKMPTIQETQTAIQALDFGSEDFVNCTGGTKLMSIGAYLAGKERQAQLLYCDTQDRYFLDLNTGKERESEFSTVAKNLTVPILMEANGNAREIWTHSETTPELLEFGRVAWELRTSQNQQFRYWNRDISQWLEQRKNDRDFELLSAAENTPLHQLTELNPTLQSYLKAAEKAGIVIRDPQNFSHFHLKLDPYKPKESLQEQGNLLIGTWLELAMIDMIQHHSNRLVSPLWSVRPTDTATTFGETDIVCVNTNSSNLTIISCKSTLQKGSLEHIEALSQRAKQIGGSHAEAVLAILQTTSPANEQELHQRAKQHNVKLWLGDEILKLIR